ncbi:hypothetical protein SAMN05216371_7286 [Streptomyces sp. TLI_053]|uniref:hypothetical protein n=1 Tax=Streptomyces sp. TLI_053 TaxID=1855352 RepID=UPI0008796D2C|nr:hypothetical protein [Streptomyces sp. TLI_053]SDT82497.1 hypothetical protein SAMN05216371_7286 [Streptomyces sp. TLI_053]
MIEGRVFADILIEGMDDWVPIDQLIWTAREEAEEESWKSYFSELLLFLLEKDLIRIGELAEGGFLPWGGSPPEILELVIDDLERLDWEPRLGSRAWIANTELSPPAVGTDGDVDDSMKHPTAGAGTGRPGRCPPR